MSSNSEDVVMIDLRSDTVTKPNEEMRLAMMNAEVGDDGYKEDPTVNELQILAAKIMGKEAALYVPSGTMSNLIALLVHCKQRGSEALVGDESHILHYENTGAAQFGGINLRTVKNLPDGTLDLDELMSKIRKPNITNQSISSVLCLENTHNRCGGRVLPLSYIYKASQIAKDHNMKFHLDGARIFNAATALGVPASHIAEPFDSISFCLSKGLGAPVGSLVVGTKEFIAEALRCRQALGGGMRQSGVIAAAGLVALKKGPNRLEIDHSFAKQLAAAAQEDGRGVVDIDMVSVETNMLMLKVLPDSGTTTHDLAARLSRSTKEEIEVLQGHDIRILARPYTATNVRMVFHCNLSSDDINLAERKLRYVLKEFQQIMTKS